MSDRRLLAALGLSLLVHALVGGSPGWRLPSLDEPESDGLLEARLAPQPLASVEPVPAPLPAEPQPRKRRVRPAPAEPPTPQVEAAAASTGVAGMAVPEAPAPPAATVAAEPAKIGLGWPRQGRIRFEVTRGEGEQATLVGQSTHSWRHDGETYALQTVTETVGLAALFRPVRVVQTSEGLLRADGIVPQEFRVERSGRTAERARFDWEGMKLTLYSGERMRREAALAAGAQDILSQIYQIGLVGAAARVELMIATGKRYGRYAYEAVGEETIETRFGALRTWHLKTPALPGEQAMELWLAPDHNNLPLRIRFTDRKGEVYEQNVVEIDIGSALPATH
jgi:Protein of unknown function (DUF3108)